MCSVMSTSCKIDMNLQEKMLGLYNLEIQSIWTHPIDKGPKNELILDPYCLIFESDDKNFLKVFDIRGEGKIGVTLEEEFDYRSNVDENMEERYRIDVIDYILEYPELDYSVEKIGCYKTEKEDNNKIICEAIEFVLCAENNDKQSIFIYTDLYGLSIGGVDKKKTWIEELYIPLYGNKVDERWF